MTESQLVATARPRLAALCAEGVTCVEIKSGYGLTLETEARMLRVARRLGSEWRSRTQAQDAAGAEADEDPSAKPSVTVSTSFLGAHALPPEFSGRADDYIDTLTREWLPEDPRLTAPKNGMHWFWDPAHVKPSFGDEMQQRVFVTQQQDIGTMLTQQNIAQHLQQQTAALTQAKQEDAAVREQLGREQTEHQPTRAMGRHGFSLAAGERDAGRGRQ